MAKNNIKQEAPKRNWLFIILFLLVLAFISFIAAGIFSIFSGVEMDDTSEAGNVALISIIGTIYPEDSSGFLDEGVSASPDVVQFIERANKNPEIKAIIFEIDSPGGSVVASKEIVDAIKKVNKTKVAWIREVGASGAYWAASATDHIVADPLSITGSIGVIGSYLDFSGFLNRYNVSYERLVAGEYKDTGIPFRKISAAEEAILQKKIDKIHDYFIKDIAKNRGIAEGNVREIATGMYYLGMEAKDLKLVDELGGKDEAIRYIEQKEKITVAIAPYKKTKGILDILGRLSKDASYSMGRGIGKSLVSEGERSYLKLST